MQCNVVIRILDFDRNPCGPFLSCVTSWKFLNFSEPASHHLDNGATEPLRVGCGGTCL